MDTNIPHNEDPPIKCARVLSWTSNARELSKKSKRVIQSEFNTDKLNNLVLTMIATMSKHNSLGLAAPQLGIKKRIIIILFNNTPLVMINPNVRPLSSSDLTPNEFTLEEGCASCPEIFVQTDFPKEVIVKYFDRSGNQNQLQLTGVYAAILIHNLNLLDGILITNDLKGEERDKAKLLSSEFIRKHSDMFIHNSTQLKQQKESLAV